MENREIKFRAWDGDEMFNDIYFTKANNRLIDVYQYNHNTLLKHVTVIDKDHLKVMQYTGLKDKNGKEIYEGDVVNWGLRNGHIEYSEVHASYIVHTYNNDPAGEWLRECYDNCMIIGNIYEHPELIKQSNEA